ncbi:MAG: DUF4258 domain-containing protein [Elusimicrobia bacterium]|nr:DUF4258 domain-containing protein [Elusimicrobiota bacterium]MBU2614025.1 DUF4258 domain-containing protein [Elusimicrobiota bacterium]
MKVFSWSNEKNKKLFTERNITFEEIVFCIEKGHLLDTIENPRRDKYKGQKIFVVEVDNYVYLVPFIETEKEIFLKTVIPNRKATKKYLKGGIENGQK